MAVATIKFSQFLDGGTLNDSDLVVGLQAGENSYFTPSSEMGYWNVVLVNTSMSGNQGYITNSLETIILSLPTTSNVGDELSIVGLGIGGWSIGQAINQSIAISPLSTTLGTGGSLSSTHYTDSIVLVCTVANLSWTTVGGVQGILTIV